MEKVKVEQVSVFLWSFNKFIINEFIVSSIDIFEKYSFPTNSLLTNLKTINAINKNKKALSLLTRRRLFNKDDSHRIRAKDAPILELLLLFKKSQQKALYITTNEKDYKEKADFVIKNKITNLTVAIYQKDELYIHEGAPLTPKKPTPRPASLLPVDDDNITFIINTSFEASSVKVLLRNERTFSSSSEKYLKRNDDRTIAKKINDNQFIYTAKFGNIKHYEYIIVLAMFENKIYASINGVYINYKSKEYEYNVDIKEKFLEVYLQRQFDRSIESDDLIVPEHKKFEYFGGRPLRKNKTTERTIVIPQEGAILRTKNNERVLIGKYIKSGGEGAVYLVRNNPNIVVKIYSNETLKKNINKQQAIEAFISDKKKIVHPYIAWPIDILFYQNNFVGFTMRKAKGEQLTEFVLGGTNGINSYSKLEIVELIIKVLEIFRYLHAHNVIVGDIKPQNIMYEPKSRELCLVDVDSVQVGPYCTKLTTRGYIPPEFSANAEKYNTFGSDNFSIFSLIFYILTQQAPYNERDPRDSKSISTFDRVKAGDFVLDGSKEQIKKHAPNYVDSMWLYLPGYLREAFINVGSKKGKNFRPEDRLTPSQWITLFRQYKKDLQSGKLRRITYHSETGVIVRGQGDARVIKDFVESYEKIGELKMDGIIKRTFKGLKLEQIVNTILRATNIKNVNREIIVNDIINNSFYDSNNLKIELIKDLGIIYELDVYYKT